MNIQTIETIILGIVSFVIIVPFILLFGALLIPTGCDCDTPWKMIPYAILKVLMILIFFFVITVNVLIKGAREYFLDHFEKYRCKPWFMPFVSLVNPKIGTQENFKHCSSISTNISFQVIATPLLNITKSIGTGLNQTQEAVTTATKGVHRMAQAAGESLERTYNETGKFQALIMVMMVKIKALFDKMMALIFNFYYALVTLLDLITIVLNIPEILMQAFGALLTVGIIVSSCMMIIFGIFSAIAYAWFSSFFFAALGVPFMSIAILFMTATVFLGLFIAVFINVYKPLNRLYQQADQASYCCFGNNTPIILNNNNIVNIQDIKVGDYLKDNNKVIGVLKVKSDVNDWYEIGNNSQKTIVASNHLMWSCKSKKWKKVYKMQKENINIKKLSVFDLNYKMRYCLVTQNHTIPTLDGVFKDFQEYSEKSEKMCKNARQTLRQLNPHQNKHNIKSDFEKGEKQSGLNQDTLISTENGYIPIKNIEIGTKLNDNGIVLGKYCVLLEKGSLLKKCSFTGNELPIDQIIWNKENRCWNKMYHEDSSETIKNNNTTIGYHLITSHGKISIINKNSKNELLIRDFLEKPLLKV